MRKFLDNKIFKICYGILRAVFVFLMVVYIGFNIIQRVNGNKGINGYRIFNVATGSMKGVYDINDIIVVKDCDPATLNVGDDISYQGTKNEMAGRLITHRIIKIEKNENGGLLITTKGTANQYEDPVITESQVIGKVVGKVPVLTPINHILKSNVGFFLIIFCPMIIIITLEILQFIYNKIDEKEDNDNEEDNLEESSKDSKKNNIDDEII